MLLRFEDVSMVSNFLLEHVATDKRGSAAAYFPWLPAPLLFHPAFDDIGKLVMRFSW